MHAESNHGLETQASEISQNVFDVVEAKGPSGVAHIFGKCINHKAVNEAPYNIVIRLSNCRQIISAKCECNTLLGNSGKCKHVAAVARFANVERDPKNKTNDPQEGNMAAEMAYPEGKTIREIFNLPKEPERPPMTDKEKRKMFELIKDIELSTSRHIEI